MQDRKDILPHFILLPEILHKSESDTQNKNKIGQVTYVDGLQFLQVLHTLYNLSSLDPIFMDFSEKCKWRIFYSTTSSRTSRPLDQLPVIIMTVVWIWRSVQLKCNVS